jgi:hypothetical protein
MGHSVRSALCEAFEKVGGECESDFVKHFLKLLLECGTLAV